MLRARDLEELLRRHGGLLKLRPSFVLRFYSDLNRLGQRKFKSRASDPLPERWIGSTIRAVGPNLKPTDGLSMLADVRGRDVSLRDAIRAAPESMLGPELLAAHGPELRVLVKILDPGEPIVFHLHATDAQVRRMPRNFRGHRFGKDEAYYFLEAPKGPMPYTHAGLHQGVTRRELVDAVRRGPQHALELSPSFYQEYETGFFTPAGVPHRPGTALTLEIQQPSDVYTLLETHSGGRAMTPQQMHPGFRSLDEAFELIDMKLSQSVGRLDDRNRLAPQPLANIRGGEIAWVFPPRVCRKFAGKRLRPASALRYAEASPLVLWVWKGRGTINGRPVRAGDELFVSFPTARTGLTIHPSAEAPLELFSFFPLA